MPNMVELKEENLQKLPADQDHVGVPYGYYRQLRHQKIPSNN